MTSQRYYPIATEYLTQSDETVFDVAQAAVNLAVEVLRRSVFSSAPMPKACMEQAYEIVYTYGDWRKMDFPIKILREFYVRNYGEEEVQAMEANGEIPYYTKKED